MLALMNSTTGIVVVLLHHWRTFAPLAFGARSFLCSFRRFLMGDKSPKNVSKQKKVQDTKKQNSKKQPAVGKK